MNQLESARPEVLSDYVAKYLRKNLDRHVTISELTAVSGVSGTTLKKHFHAVYGMPIYAWFKRERMLSAARALVETQDSILKIAGDYGYENASKFSGAFRDVLGLSPREYRKNPQADAS